MLIRRFGAVVATACQLRDIECLFRISGYPQLRQAYYKEGPSGVWRPPEINETCCARAHLADLLDDVALSGPDVLYNGSYTQVSSQPASCP